MNHCTLQFDTVKLPYALRFPDTVHYLKRYLSESSDLTRQDPVSVSHQEFADWESAGNGIDAFAEFCLLCQQTSQHLFAFDRCVFHAAAIRWRNRAWLIAGGSGVGKSTQCRTLMELWPDEIQVINGDKPILSYQQDGTVMVCPSPWNGKEGWHGAEAAPLAGIFFLSRGPQDSVKTISTAHAAPLAYLCVFQDYRDANVIRQCGVITQRILQSCPLWSVTSCHIPDSTHLLYQTMRQEVANNGI